MAIRTLVELKATVYDPRKDGWLASAGARYDWGFWSEDDWALQDCEVQPKLGALCLRHIAQPEDQQLTHWTFSANATKWLRIKPAPDDKFWVKQPIPDNTARVTATSHKAFGAEDGSLSIWLRTDEPLSNAPTAGASRLLFSLEYPHVSVEFNPQDTAHYMLLFPEGAVGAGHPVLAYTADGGTTWKGVHEFTTWTQERDKSVSVRVAPRGYVLFTWERGEHQTEALYLPDWPSDPVKLRIGGRGLAWAWCIGKPVYPLNENCYAYLSSGYQIHPRATAAYTAYHDGEDNDQTVTVTRYTDADNLFRAQVLLRTDDETVTPWVYRVGFEHLAAFGSPTATTVYSSTTSARTLTGAKWAHGNEWRGASATLNILDLTEALEFASNQIVELQVRLVGDVSWVNTFRGRVKSAQWAYGYTENEVRGRRWTLDCTDEAWRLEKKRRGHLLGSLAGKTFTQAVRLALNHAGVPDTRIRVRVPGALYGWAPVASVPSTHDYTIPWTEGRAGELRFSPGTPITQVLDRICQICGYQWGVNSGPGVGTTGGDLDSMAWGDVCFWPTPHAHEHVSGDAIATFDMVAPASPYENNGEFTLDAAMDGSDWAPIVEVEGQDWRGHPISAFATRENSIDTDTDALYIGDDFDDVTSCPEEQTPWRHAQERLTELSEGLFLYSWHGPPNLTVRPDDILSIAVVPGGSRLVRLIGVSADAQGGAQTPRCLMDYRARGVL